MEVLKIALLRGDMNTVISASKNVINIKGASEIRFQSEEVIPKSGSLNDSLPQIAMVFNSPRRVLRIPGFPALLREKAEFFEVGELRSFRVCKFISTVRKYANI